MAINVVFVGNLGADPEFRTMNDGTPVLKLRVAVNERRKVDGEWKDVPTWCSVDWFGGRRAESLTRILEKGSKVEVRGTLSVREYDGRNGRAFSVDVRADSVELVGGGKPREQGAQPQNGGSRYGNSGAGNAAKHSAPREQEHSGVDHDRAYGGVEDDLPF